MPLTINEMKCAVDVDVVVAIANVATTAAVDSGHDYYSHHVHNKILIVTMTEHI